MKTTPRFRAALLTAAACCCLPLLAGCGKSAPTHFYSLSASPSQTAEAPAGPCLSLGIGPIDFPAYLDRSPIVTRLSQNQMHLADFDQWIEPLRENFQRILTENLASLVCAKPLVTYPWPAGGHPDRQVVIQVASFDGSLGEQARLKASWSVLDADGKPLTWRTVEHHEAAAGPDYAALAAAQSRLVEKFAKDVAESLRGQ